jgi:DNA-directed RNA polymerase subunit RPC12/RpoP
MKIGEFPCCPKCSACISMFLENEIRNGELYRFFRCGKCNYEFEDLTPDYEIPCKVCGKELKKNNPRQVVFYCSKECREKRHEKVTPEELE